MQFYKYPALLVMLSAVLLNACSSTPTATMDFDSSYDFSGVRKIAIQPINRTVSSTVIISDMQISRINETLTEELGRRGFQVVQNNADADLFLAWHLVTQERMDVRSFNTSSRYNCWNCGSMGNNVSVRQYTQGTFIVDMIDPTRLQSVWRSIFESRMRDQPDPATAAENRRAAAAAVFSAFPPKQ